MNRLAAFEHPGLLSLLFCALMAMPAVASSEPIVIASTRIDANWGVGGGAGLQPDLVGEFFFEVSTPSLARVRLFDVPVTSADVGRTFRVTGATEPDFGVAAAALSDGIDAFHGYGLQFADGFYVTQSVTEGEIFHGRLGFPDPNPDLQGFRLTAITTRLDRLVVQADPFFGRQVFFTGVMAFEGFADSAPVPEPTSILLMATGLGVIGRRAWNRRGQRPAAL